MFLPSVTVVAERLCFHRCLSVHGVGGHACMAAGACVAGGIKYVLMYQYPILAGFRVRFL